MRARARFFNERQKMSSKLKTLVIVESPSKAKTIGRMLGSRYKVVASVGHVRDLPKSKLGIDIENNFEPYYINIRGKGDVIKNLKKEAKNASRVYLATDPDREGEAISWHIAYLLGISPDEPCRVEFHEITKNAVKTAIKNPRKLNLMLVDAQQARRILDRLVGYQISPLLWRKIRRGLSAGRVQSAALKIIVDREKEIIDFVPEEYWTIQAEFRKGTSRFTGDLIRYGKEKISLKEEKDADRILDEIAQGRYMVDQIEKKEKKSRPSDPFRTSTLQQTAAGKLNFTARKTMQIAQQLYEGVDIKGRGTTGLITYMRTDSIRVSQEADEAVKKLIVDDYGSDYLGTNEYVNRNAGVQDAHEAIRPTDPFLRPDEIKDSLTNDQFKLYDLIWRRFTASRMKSAVYESTTAEIENAGYIFKASGSRLVFDGYTRVAGRPQSSAKQKQLPALEKGEEVSLAKPAKDRANPMKEQHFTVPPPRYTEATLIRELEEKGIGRPSTYAPIVATLSERRYVKKEKKSLVPQEIGFQVADLMDHYFTDIVNAGFTADMERKLDQIEEDGIDWHDVVSDFYVGFSKDLENADQSIAKIVIADEPTGRSCPSCGKNLVIKHGRFGRFIACSGYPECKYTESIKDPVGVKCPSCGKDILRLRSKRGKIYYRCDGYPDCDVLFWDRPVDRKCPKCGSLLTEKAGRSPMYLCSDRECGYKEKKTVQEGAEEQAE